MINPIETIKRRGLFGSINYTLRLVAKKAGWYKVRFRNIDRYHGPTNEELFSIENALIEAGIAIEEYCVDQMAFIKFKSKNYFPDSYYDGNCSHVREEKLLEHYIAADRLNLFEFSDDDIYVDIAACGSPWAEALRIHLGLNAYAIDLEVSPIYQDIDYYRQENATATHFNTSAVKGASLQCAFEMFKGSDDIDFIKEASRILAPGGKIVIAPLYMHTHYCAYSTPEYCGKGYSDINSKEYICHDFWGVPSSRKYDVDMLKTRLLDLINQVGLNYRLLVLRNKSDLGENIYCHFILEIMK